MKLWDSLTTCLILLSAVRPSSLLPSRQQPASAERREAAAESPLEVPPIQIRLSVTSPDINPTETAGKLEQEESYTMKELLQNDKNVMDFIKIVISRVRRSSSAEPSSTSTSFSPYLSEKWSRNQQRRERKKGAKLKNSKDKKRERKGEEMSKKSGSGGGRGQGCVLRQIHLNVTDLGLGYSSSEEMIFRYCSGPCRKSETNYDKILLNLVNKRRLPTKDMPLQACCRPIAFDNDLSFLDDNLIYHTVRKHSARKCGCV